MTSDRTGDRRSARAAVDSGRIAPPGQRPIPGTTPHPAHGYAPAEDRLSIFEALRRKLTGR